MYKKCLPFVLSAFIFCSTCGRATLAASDKIGTPRSNQIQATVSKLVRESKAERDKLLVSVPQKAPHTKGNNLSKGAKVAIGVGIVAAIVAVIFVVKSPVLNDGR